MRDVAAHYSQNYYYITWVMCDHTIFFSEKASLFRSEPYIPYTIQIMVVQFNSLCINVPCLY